MAAALDCSNVIWINIPERDGFQTWPPEAFGPLRCRLPKAPWGRPWSLEVVLAMPFFGRQEPNRAWCLYCEPDMTGYLCRLQGAGLESDGTMYDRPSVMPGEGERSNVGGKPREYKQFGKCT